MTDPRFVDDETEKEFQDRWSALYDDEAIEYQPWLPRTARVERQQAAIRIVLAAKAGAKKIGRNVFISRHAKIFTSSLVIGDNTWIAAGAILRGHIRIGDDTSVNPYSHIAGSVRIGSGVRIAGATAIYGFNHGFDKTDVPIYRQRQTMKGVVIGDGCWVGTNAVIVDGCTIGRHCIVTAGAVVTKNFADYEIIGGNPARTIRSRLVSTEPLTNE